MNCKNCGKPLSVGESFCLACGTMADGGVIRGNSSVPNVPMPQYGQQGYPSQPAPQQYGQGGFVQQVYVAPQAAVTPDLTVGDVFARIGALLIVILFAFLPVIPLFSLTFESGSFSLKNIGAPLSSAEDKFGIDLSDGTMFDNNTVMITLLVIFIISLIAYYICLFFSVFRIGYSNPKGGKYYWSIINTDSIFFLVNLILIWLYINHINSLCKNNILCNQKIISVSILYYLIAAAAISLCVFSFIKFKTYQKLAVQHKNAKKAYKAYKSGVPPYNYGNNNNGNNNYPMH